MKPLSFILSFIFTALISSAQPLPKQVVKGTVTDEQSGSALAQVTIMIDVNGTPMAATTDSLGHYTITRVPVGRYNIRAGMVGYEEAFLRNIEVTSSREVIADIKLRERVQKGEQATVTAGRSKSKALNETALVSARQLSMDEAFRYSGTRNDPSRMAQNFAGVSGANDARNDIIIRGNSPTGVLWRMDGVDIPNPNHYSTIGSTGGPVTLLNTNTLKNSDFMTGAFPAQYGNALAGVFDLRMRNGNTDKYEFLGQAGFNGFEFAAEGPVSRRNKSSFLVDYRYSLIAAVQAAGLSVGTGSSTPYYQDLHFKLNFPTRRAGTFSVFGLGGESHIRFPYDEGENLYVTNDGSVRNRNFKSLTGITGFNHQYFFNRNTSGRLTLAVSGTHSDYEEEIVLPGSVRPAFDVKNTQLKYTAQYVFNKKFDARNQLTAGITADWSKLDLKQRNIRNGDSVLTTLFQNSENAVLFRAFVNENHRFNPKLSTNLGVYYQFFGLNNSFSIEPRWNLKYQFRPNQSLSLGTGLHSQVQPLQVYFYESRNAAGEIERTNKNLGFTRSAHGVLGYDINLNRNLRFKSEVYAQYIFDAPVERHSSSFSLLNYGADFGFPERFNLVNKGRGYNYGAEFTLERFLNKGYYYLFTASVFDSRFRGSDGVWRNTAFNNNYVFNALAGKEFVLNKTSSFGIDTKIAYAGGQRYTPFDYTASQSLGYTVYRENEAFSLQNSPYWRWDLKFSYTRNGRKTTQKWYIDLQNLTNKNNVYLRSLNPKTGSVSEINQIGFFPNINYQITF